MTGSQFLTAPTSEYAEIVLDGVASDTDDPVEETLQTLANPRNYTHVLDMRRFDDDE